VASVRGNFFCGFSGYSCNIVDFSFELKTIAFYIHCVDESIVQVLCEVPKRNNRKSQLESFQRMPSIESSPHRTDRVINHRHQAHGQRSSPSRHPNPRVRMIFEDERDDTTLTGKYGRLAIERAHRSPSSGLALRQHNILANAAAEEVSFVTWAPTHQGGPVWRRQGFHQDPEISFRPPDLTRRPIVTTNAPPVFGPANSQPFSQRYQIPFRPPPERARRPVVHAGPVFGPAGGSRPLPQRNQLDPRLVAQPPLWYPTSDPYDRVGRRPPPPFPMNIEIPRRIQIVTENDEHRPRPPPMHHNGIARAPPPSSSLARRPPSAFRERKSSHDPGQTIVTRAEPLPRRVADAQTGASNKRPLATQLQADPIIAKRSKGFDKLDMLCSATLEIGELHDNPNGCSCPKSRCIALYCDCFKAGRRCNPSQCSCTDCKNTIIESGPDGARTKAIRSILARNPRAFTTAGMGNPLLKLPPGEIACSCVRSRCLKLYCSCFHHGRACRPGVCTCVGKYHLPLDVQNNEVLTSTRKDCHNTENDEKGHRRTAIQMALEKRPDAFNVKAKEKGQGCACKNNRCIRKYCECFRTGILCTSKCSCRNCENNKPEQSESGDKPRAVDSIKVDRIDDSASDLPTATTDETSKSMSL
jgi:hypothetical protein